MILCHKCSGVLVAFREEDRIGLYGCSCISGWVRDWQEPVTRAQAIAAQVKATEGWIKLFIGQGRREAEIAGYRDRLAGLQALNAVGIG